jgi:Na+/phosphate symporter
VVEFEEHNLATYENDLRKVDYSLKQTLKRVKKYSFQSCEKKINEQEPERIQTKMKFQPQSQH